MLSSFLKACFAFILSCHVATLSASTLGQCSLQSRHVDDHRPVFNWLCFPHGLAKPHAYMLHHPERLVVDFSPNVTLHDFKEVHSNDVKDIRYRLGDAPRWVVEFKPGTHLNLLEKQVGQVTSLQLMPQKPGRYHAHAAPAASKLIAKKHTKTSVSKPRLLPKTRPHVVSHPKSQTKSHHPTHRLTSTGHMSPSKKIRAHLLASKLSQRHPKQARVKNRSLKIKYPHQYV